MFSDMKVVVAGSRENVKQEDVDAAMAEFIQLYCTTSHKDICEVVSGSARGADRLGEKWAQKRGIDVKRFEAKWVNEVTGKKDFSAGVKRNSAMAKYGDACVAIWDAESTGTLDMIRKARQENMIIHVYILPRKN